MPSAPSGSSSSSNGRAALRRSDETTRQTWLHGQPVTYRLRRTSRRSIGMAVSAEGLTVAAPHWLGAGRIEAALHEKAAWVLRKLAEQRERAARLEAGRIEWRDGATLPFLGRTVRLALDERVTGVMLDAAQVQVQTQTQTQTQMQVRMRMQGQGSGADPGPVVTDGAATLLLVVGLPATAAATQVRAAVQGWLQRQARRVFEERCAHYAPRLRVRMQRLALSSARTRWGSASADGSVRLNWRLVHLPLEIIDYVVAHELAHLRHMDHSPQFWDVVRSVVPDLEQARQTLRRVTLPALE